MLAHDRRLEENDPDWPNALRPFPYSLRSNLGQICKKSINHQRLKEQDAQLGQISANHISLYLRRLRQRVYQAGNLKKHIETTHEGRRFRCPYADCDEEYYRNESLWQLENDTRGLTFVDLDMETAKLIAFVDASFANNKDYSSQTGYVIALADAKSNANIIHWSSTKCTQITRSVLASNFML